MEDKFSFIVNGKTIVTTEDVNLLDFLRDDLGLISVKDGCKEGACGTCTILVDGKAMKSCIFTTKKVAGKEKKKDLHMLSQSVELFNVDSVFQEW